MRACGDGLALVIPAHQIGRDCESLKVFGVERCATIGGLQQPIRFRPRRNVARFVMSPVQNGRPVG